MSLLLHVPDDVFLLRSKIATLQGRVLVDGVEAIRRIVVYKNQSTDEHLSTYSDSNGNWSIDVMGNNNDSFRVICIGENENSQVFEDVRVP